MQITNLLYYVKLKNSSNINVTKLFVTKAINKIQDKKQIFIRLNNLKIFLWQA